jgi:hypothetical protein
MAKNNLDHATSKLSTFMLYNSVPQALGFSLSINFELYLFSV